MTRAMYVSPAFTSLDGPVDDPRKAVRSTPGEIWAMGFGALLDRVAGQMSGEGVLVLDPAAITSFRLPAGPGDEASVGLDDARAAGWLHGQPRPWMEFYGEGRPKIVVGLSSWPDFVRPQSLTDGCTSPVDLPFRLSLWHDLTGHAWRGSPGIAGMTILRETLPQVPVKNVRRRPSLKMVDGPDDAYELDWTPDDWSRPAVLTDPWQPEGRYAHGYDATRMYLAAAQTIECLAPWKLVHTGKRGFSATRGGWWKVALGPWNVATMPSPAGPGAESVRWVTTPTLALLHQLREDGNAFQDFEIVDSWTAEGKRLLRGWGETLEHTYQRAREISAVRGDTDPWEDGEAVRVAAKAAYRETIGLLKPNAGPDHAVTYRPDWHYSIIALARANLWRRLWKVGHADGRWPLEIQVDHVWYGSDNPDPLTACPPSLPLKNADGKTDALGTFKPKGTRERGKA